MRRKKADRQDAKSAKQVISILTCIAYARIPKRSLFLDVDG
jgi:hypothetical protein